MNWISILVAALIPTVVGFIYYNPKVMGTAWMKAADMTEEKIRNANMGVIFGVSIVLSLMLAMFIHGVAVHQDAMFSLLASDPEFNDPNSEIRKYFDEFMSKYGDRHRSFGHGALHGTLAGIFGALPILGTNSLFERKGFKYIAVNVGYWIITLALMGGLMCAWV
jgi:hypothetical protein